MTDIFTGRAFHIVPAPHDDRDDEDRDFDLLLENNAHVGVLFDGRHVGQTIADRLNAHDALRERAEKAERMEELLTKQLECERETVRQLENSVAELISERDGWRHEYEQLQDEVRHAGIERGLRE